MLIHFFPSFLLFPLLLLLLIVFFLLSLDFYFVCLIQTNGSNELEQVKKASLVLLSKMMDPCLFMPPCVDRIHPQGGQQCPAYTFCAVHCLFINTVASLHTDTPPMCKMLKGGSCSEGKCICNHEQVVRKTTKTSPVRMALCNNALRHQLLDPSSYN